MSKTVLITGVSKNIGRSICRKFVKNGYMVIGTYRTEFDDEELKAKFLAEFPNTNLYKVDFCNKEEVTTFIDQMKKYQFDVIVNNAGMVSLNGDNVRNEFTDFDVDSFYDVINCNLIAPTRISLELKDNIKENGVIVNISSGAALNAGMATISYNASKAALTNVGASLSNSFPKYKNKMIRVNNVLPGWIDADTDGAMNMNEDSIGARALKVTPLGRNGKTSEISDIVYFLTTDEASFINGANISVDGGYSNFDVIYYEEATGDLLLK